MGNHLHDCVSVNPAAEIQLRLERCGRLALRVCHRTRGRGSDLLSRSSRAQAIWNGNAVFRGDSSLRRRLRRIDSLRQFVLGQLACILTAIAGTCFLLIIAVTAPFHPSGAAAPLSLVCAGLWLSGSYYAELPATSALLLALAPAIALLPVGKKSNFQSRALAYRTAFVAVPVAIAVVLALHASPPLDY